MSRFYSTGKLKPSPSIQIGRKNWDCVLPAAAADVNFGTLLGEKFEATSRSKHPTVVTCMKKGTSKVQVFLQY
jgi:hypothetical protein